VDEAPRQRLSHPRLLTPVERDEAPTEPIAAIIVPTFRPAAHLDHIREVADHLRCRLLVLCSGGAKATEVIAACAPGATLTYAIDIPWPRSDRLDPFDTTKVRGAALGPHQRDTGLKRNLGLLLARSNGWERIVFIDDDIIVPNPDDLRRAAALTDRYDVVGLHNIGFPDNSVVFHARRHVHDEQGTFIGGGAMALSPNRVNTFFPEIYNEDWLFLIDDDRLLSVATIGYVTQEAYDPYDDPGRADREEFGDCLAEGLFSLLDQTGSIGEADNVEYWRRFTGDRDRLIASIVGRIPSAGVPVEVRPRMTASLDAARDRLHRMDPSDFTGYLHAWREDRRRWLDRLDSCPRTDSVEDAAEELGVDRDRVYRTGALTTPNGTGLPGQRTASEPAPAQPPTGP
jgi:hypothetical protein